MPGSEVDNQPVLWKARRTVASLAGVPSDDKLGVIALSEPRRIRMQLKAPAFGRRN